MQRPPEILFVMARIALDRKDYNGAEKLLSEAVENEPGNLHYLLWLIYARYIKAEFTFSPGGANYRAEMALIMRQLERLKRITENKPLEYTYILYFLGCFYYKSGELFESLSNLKKCVRVKPKCAAHHTACEWLGYIWDHDIHPSLWRWWFNSPVHTTLRRSFGSAFSIILIFLLFGHPFLPSLLPWYEINWTIYIIILALLIALLVLPVITRVKMQDVEIELQPPLDVGTVLSPLQMEAWLSEMEYSPAAPSEK